MSLLCVSPEGKQQKKNALKAWKAGDKKAVFIQLKPVYTKQHPGRPRQPVLREAPGGDAAAEKAAGDDAERTALLRGGKAAMVADGAEEQGVVSEKILPSHAGVAARVQDNHVCNDWSKVTSNGGSHLTGKDCSSIADKNAEDTVPGGKMSKHTTGPCDDILYMGLSQGGHCVQL